MVEVLSSSDCLEDETLTFAIPERASCSGSGSEHSYGQTVASLLSLEC